MQATFRNCWALCRSRCDEARVLVVLVAFLSRVKDRVTNHRMPVVTTHQSTTLPVTPQPCPRKAVKFNATVHRAMANDIDFRTRLARGLWSPLGYAGFNGSSCVRSHPLTSASITRCTLSESPLFSTECGSQRRRYQHSPSFISIRVPFSQKSTWLLVGLLGELPAQLVVLLLQSQSDQLGTSSSDRTLLE